MSAAVGLPEPSALQVVGGAVLLVLLFALREVAGGALRAAGADLWAWLKRRRRAGARDA